MSPALMPDTDIAFYKIEEVKDVLAYCCVILNPKDEDALLRIINIPNRSISEETIKNLLVFADQHDLSLWDSLRTCELENTAAEEVREFVQLINELRRLINEVDAYHFLQKVVIATKLVDHYARLDKSDHKHFLVVNQLLDRARLFSTNEEYCIADYLLKIARLEN